MLAFALTALGYAAAGIAALPLAIPPGYATPLYPAAGIALASVLIFGRRMLPAVALGAFGLDLWLGMRGRGLGGSALPLALATGLGAALQALAGAALVRRHLPQPLSLSEPRDIAKFLAVAIVSCPIGPGIAGAALLLAQVVPAS